MMKCILYFQYDLSSRCRAFFLLISCIAVVAVINFGAYDSYGQFRHGEDYAQYQRQSFTAYSLDTNYNYEKSRTGTETVWDFSDARIDIIDTFGNAFFDASDIYFSDQFPGANTVFYNELHSSFEFFKQSGTHLIKAGNVILSDTDSKIVSVTVNTDPDTLYSYPLCITAPRLSNVKRVQMARLHNLQVCTIDSTISEIETSGELILPYGVFKNVFKKKYFTTQYGILKDSNRNIIADLVVFITVKEWVQQFNSYPPLLRVCLKETYFKVRKKKGDFHPLSYNYFVLGFVKNDSAVSTIRHLTVSDIGTNQVAVRCELSCQSAHVVTVYDMAGRVTDSKLMGSLPDENNRCSTVFNMADYPAGIYIFKVHNEKEFNTIKWIRR